MKKLMFAAVAAVAMAAVCEATIQSSNIVGFNNNSNEGQRCPILGPQFFAVSGAETFKLQDLSIPGSREWDDGEWDLHFLNPANEYIRVFGTDSVGEIAAYTYVSENMLIDVAQEWEEEEPDISEYEWALGWWKYEMGTSYVSIIKRGASDPDAIRLQVKEDIPFPNGTGFVGSFTKGQEHDIVTQGGVAIETFAFETDGTRCPIFVNQLPVDIDLSDMTIPGSREWDDGEWDLKFLNPANEYIRVFGTDSVGEIAAYTYVSENMLIDVAQEWEEEEPDISEYEWALGWWKYEMGTSYVSIIKRGASDPDAIRLQVKEPIVVSAGRGFVGSFTKGQEHKIYFPGATSVPSKQ